MQLGQAWSPDWWQHSSSSAPQAPVISLPADPQLPGQPGVSPHTNPQQAHNTAQQHGADRQQSSVQQQDAVPLRSAREAEGTANAHAPAPHSAAGQGTAGASPAGASPDSQSDFGSFTGHDSPADNWNVETASEHTTLGQQQAPGLLSAVTGSASGGDAVGSTATGQPAQLQHMDRSAPISLGLFGEESYEDPALNLPGQPTALRL